MKKKVGLTTTVPVEVVFASGFEPVDLNNLFIQHPDPSSLIARAEQEGMSRNCCAWIKGLYSLMLEQGDIEAVIGVSYGDCSNTHGLLEVLTLHSIEVIPFAYPPHRDGASLRREINNLISHFGTSWERVLEVKKALDSIRKRLAMIDRRTYQEGTIRGAENHLFLVSSSDFKGDIGAFAQEVDEFLEASRWRPGAIEPSEVRLGYIGVPPAFKDLYTYLESLGARVMYNEVQRQFSMPFHDEGLVEQYLRYTYPYGFLARWEDIVEAVRERKLQGLIHYVQLFCFRQMEDILLRRLSPVPVLTVEGDEPGPLDARTKLRLHAFVEMLRQKNQQHVGKKRGREAKWAKLP